MSSKEHILDLYYNQHLKQNEIATIVATSSQYVSKVIKSDYRYKEEKENRKQVSSQKRATYLKEYFKGYKRPKKEDNTYAQLLALQKQDAIELSYTSSISDYAFAKWNSSIYHRNKKGNLILDKKIKVSADVPKSINMNIKVPTQKYNFR